ncbi:unnamed protein product, partial [Haemonchus placei]|uniref:CX domain-containing protein n=1 Tax=Haemonchus placei TaxID=6290 RepID=A0A0N4WUF8_HAEPC
VSCPATSKGHVLECAYACCPSFEGADQSLDQQLSVVLRHYFQGYYCCGPDEVQRADSGHTRAERFIAYGSTFQIDYTLLIIGLIVSIVLSILLSFFCCLLCNGCWLHRRRNPHLYETVNESGWYPICCGFGIPMGTVVFSTHPPHYRDDSEMYHGSSTSSLPSSKQR